MTDPPVWQTDRQTRFRA